MPTRANSIILFKSEPIRANQDLPSPLNQSRQIEVKPVIFGIIVAKHIVNYGKGKIKANQDLFGLLVICSVNRQSGLFGNMNK